MENQEKPKNGKGKEDQNDPKYLSKMIKEMAQTVNNYMLTTTQEIDNIKKIVEINHKSSVEVKEKINNITRDVDIRIQNIINIQKEIASKHETLKSLVEGMIENTQNIQADREYVEHKQTITGNAVYQKAKADQNILKAILYDKYHYSKATIVTNNKEIKIYPVTISTKYSIRPTYYILYQNKWQKLRKVANLLREEGLIFGYKNIIRAIRSKQGQTSKKRILENSSQ